MSVKTPVLETERLILRPTALSDVPAIQRHIDNWAVVSQLSTQVPWPYPPDGALTWLRDMLLPKVAAGHAHGWVLVPRGESSAIGAMVYRCGPEDTDHRGFWLAEPYWGRGLMTEATWAMQDWIFGVLGVDHLDVHNAVSNIASRRVKEKSGAVLIGTAEIAHHHGDNRCEHWRITREGWLAFRASNSP